MSAICGIIHFNGDNVDRIVFGNMMSSMADRGVDGSDQWIKGCAALGIQMLYSTPESLTEVLPQTNQEGSLVLTADARIDNREELIQNLSLAASNRNAVPDSLLILKSYEKWGDHCAQYLIGEFAFVIWDALEQKLFCCRDHLGFRPLYYFHSGDRFIFCSEVRPIPAAAGLSIELNETALLESMMMRLMDTDITFINRIKQIPAAHSITITRNQLKKNQYWQPLNKPRIRLGSSGEYQTALRELVIQSVHSSMRSVFPVAVQLSGGVDSSAVTAIAARKLKDEGKSLIAVSSVLPLGRPGPERDDRENIAHILRQEKNIDVHHVTAEGISPFYNLDELIEYFHAPLEDPFYFMDHALKSTALRLGARILLNGAAGDMAASYHGHSAIYQLIREMRWSTAVKLIRNRHKVENTAVFKLIKKEILSHALPAGLLTAWKRIRGRKPLNMGARRLFQDAVSESDAFQTCHRRYQLLYRDAGSPYQNILRGISPQSDYANTLAYTAQTGGLFSLYPASPLLDKRIIEFMMRVPPEQLVLGGWSRSLFRRAMEGILPREIQWRQSKHPFAPDFHSRMIRSKNEIRKILAASEHSSLEDKYIKKACILEQLDKIKPASGWNDWDCSAQEIIFRGTVMVSFLRWIKKRFDFEKQ